MVFPRQRLYRVGHGRFLKAACSGGLNRTAGNETAADLEHAVQRVFRDYTDIERLVPLSRGRLAAYFAVKHSVTAARRKVILSPFTIFDLVNMVRLGGGEPHFIDSKPGSVHPSLSTIEREIDDQTAAVIITHYHSTNHDIGAIAELCRSRGVKLIEDCAISLGSRIDGIHVGHRADFALFSFGLFKFVSTYFGGGMHVRDPAVRQKIEDEINGWPRMTARDLAPYAVKGLKLSILTQKQVFDHFTFPLFRHGYLNDVEVIKKNAQNDPDPFLRTSFPDSFRRRPSLFQLREFARQIPLVEQDRKARVANADRYFTALQNTNVGGLPEKPDAAADSCLNFPIIVETNREAFVREMMRSGFDTAIYYYRNCSELPAFKQYRRSLPNIDRFASKMVFFPVYPGVTSDYIDRLTKRTAELLA